MHWTRRVGVLYLLIVGWAGFASAQDIVNDSSGVVYLEDFSGSMSLSDDGGTYLLFHRMIGDGVGIRDGYTRLGIRGKIIDEGLAHIFGEAHALITDGPRVGYNVGLGYRQFAGAGLLGGHVWFDDYGSEGGNRYQQIVFGAEYLHPDFDIRTNVYLPISDDENFLYVTDAGTTTGFMGNNIVSLGRGIYERAYNAYEGEVGIPVPVIEWLRGYIGGYALERSDDAIYGVRARVEGRVARDITLNAMVTNDNQFGTNLNLGVEVRLSNQGLPTRFGGQNYSAMARRYDQVQRQWNTHIVFDEDDVKVPLTLGGDVLTAVFVDDSAAPGGTGTFESPLNMLPDDVDSDFVLVHTGNQMTQGTIALNVGQQLLGEGKIHLIETDLLGTVPLPTEFAQTGPAPTLLGDGTATPVITLHDSTRVSSFNFAAQNAVFGTDITNFQLECLTGNVLNGINVTAAGGVGIVNDINFALMPGGNGVEVRNTTGLLNLDLDNIATTGGARGLIIDADGGDIAYTADNVNTTGASVAGVALLADSADLSGTINALNSSLNPGHGVLLHLDNSATGLTQINDPIINGNGIDGIHAEAIDGSTYTLNVIGSSAAVASISGNGDDNVDADSIDASTFNVFIDPITMSAAGDNGFEFMTDTGATLNATLQDIVMQVNTDNAIDGVVTGSSIANLTVTGTNGSGSGIDGVHVETSNLGQFNALIMDSIFSGNADDGYEFISTSGGIANVTMMSSLGNGNGDAGLQFSAVTGFNSGPGEVNIDATGVDLSGNLINNIRGEATQGGLATIDLVNVRADDSAVNGGVVLEASQNGDLSGTWVGGSASNTLNDGIRLTASGAGSDLQFLMSDLDVNGNANEGLQLDASAGANGTMGISNSTVSNNAGDGVRVTSMTTGVASAQFDTVDGSSNAQNGLNFSADSGGQTSILATNSTFSNSGAAGGFSGVRGTSTDPGSSVTASFDGVDASSNTLHGFEFNVTNMASLWANIESTSGTSSANLNQGSGVQFTGTNANEALLTMSGDNQFIGNGTNIPSSGVNYDVSNTNVAVAGFSGESSGNALDGVTIAMTDVTTGAIDLNGGLLMGNAEDGADINLTNTVLSDVIVGGQLISGFNINGVTAINNGLDGVNVNANNTDLTSGSITDLVANFNQNGLVIDLNNGSDWNLEVTDSIFNDNLNYGLHVLSDSNDTMSVLNIHDNRVAGNGDTNVQVDLTGTANMELHIDDNLIDGDGVISGFTERRTIQGGTLNDSFVIPPDTMGGVGTDHIVEFTNGAYTVYDKETGAELFTSTLDDFWLSAGQLDVGGGTFDPRVIFDPTVNRWFMTSIDDANGTEQGNDIYVAVSLTDNPLDGFQSVRFQADALGIRFNDFDTLGVDADGVYIGTSNFTTIGQADTSLYFIPKADLLAATPTLANMTRFENLDSDTVGPVLQPIVDFGPSDGIAKVIAMESPDATGFGFGGELRITEILDTDTGAPTLGFTDFNFVSSYQNPNGGSQPGATDVEHDDSRFWSNVVSVDGTIWAAHSILGSSGNDAVRWYKIDEATNSVIQTGTLEDSNLDYLYPSIAVNETGQVVIGMSISGPNQFISSGAAYGDDFGGFTSFEAPVILNEGVATYEVFDGNFRNRWGDYSATVVDPEDANTFWTFQERVVAPDTWGIDIVEINYNTFAKSSGTTLNDGVSVNVSGNAVLSNSSLNNNTITGVGDTAVAVSFSNSTMSTGLTIDGNDITNNGGLGVDVSIADSSVLNNLSISQNTNMSSNFGGPGIQVVGTASGQLDALTIDNNLNVANNGGTGIHVDFTDFTLGGLSISNNDPVSNNAGNGIDVSLDTVTGTPDVFIDNNVVMDNTGQGITLSTIDTPLGNVSASQNIITGNPVGDGLAVNIDNVSGVQALSSIALDSNEVSMSTADAINLFVNNAGPSNSISVSGNRLEASGDDAIDVTLVDSATGIFSASNNVVLDSGSRGVILDATNSPISDLIFDGNVIANSMAGDGLLVNLTNSAVSNTLDITNSNLEDNFGNGLTLNLDGSPINNINISGNDAGTALPGGTIDVDFSNLIWTTTVDNNSTAGLDIASFSVDLTSAGRVWRSDQTPFQDRFQVQDGSDVTVGLTAVNGVAVNAGTDPLEDLMGNVLPEGGVATGSTIVTFDFNDFTSGEQFHYNLAHSLPSMSINGDITGAIGTVTLTDGRMASATATNGSGFNILQTFNQTFGGISTNGGHGVLINAINGSDIGSGIISGNAISGNGTHGIEIVAVDSALPDSVTPLQIVGNEITDQPNGDGFRMINPDTNGAPIGVNFTGNTFSNNTGTGINVSVNADSGGLTSVIDSNTVSGNGVDGLTITATDVPVTTTITNNTFDGNTENGVALENGTHTLTANIITNNGNDGVELVSNSSVSGLTVTADNNFVGTNGGRGLNTLVVGNTLADITVTNSTFDGNMLEGAYIYQTTSTARDVDADGTSLVGEGMGDITSNPQLVFNFHNNVVTGNGALSGMDGTGLVLRVGTSGASAAANSFEDAGGFVSDGLGFTAANLTGRGGVLASITGNVIDTNMGADVLIESFASTIDPVDTVGTWDGAAYDITTYEQDPLARLDLNFEGNTGGLTDVVRAGYFFSNPEDVFKSRTTAQATAGPFTDGSRLRNSQRLAAREVNMFGDFTDPAVNTVGVSGDSANFLYSGVGGSTFRVTGTSTTAGFTDVASDSFTDLLFDGFDSTGTLQTGSLLGELPFGYDIIP